MLVIFQKRVALQLLVGFPRFAVEDNGHNVLNVIRQFQIIRSFHRHANVGNRLTDSRLRTVLRRIRPALLVRMGGVLRKERLAVTADCPAQTRPAVQKKDLRPQVLQTVRGGRPGQFHQTANPGQHQFQRFEPFALRILETARFVQHHHIEGPVVPVVIHQPRNVLPVNDPDISGHIQSQNPLFQTAQNRDNAQAFQVLPFRRLATPRRLRDFFRCHYQTPTDCPAIKPQVVYRRQRDNRLAEAHI